METVNVLVTGSGAPGISGTLYSLKNNFDNRVVKSVGTDINKDAVGRYLCDEFYTISRPSEEDYISQMLSICDNESINVLLPQNTAELPILAKYKKYFESVGTKVAISSVQSIALANNKYRLMSIASKIGVPTPEFYLADNFGDLMDYAKKLGWPEGPVIVKPPVSNGMRGLRIIDESINLKDSFYSEKPNGVYTNINNLNGVLGDSFPQLLVMEYLPGEEYTVDLLGNKRFTVVVPRKRDSIRSGISFNGTVEKNEPIIKYSKMLSAELKLQYAYGFQFKLDANNIPKLLESNPRIQGTMVLSTFAGANLIYGAVKQLLGEEVPEFDIKWGTKLFRYWGGIGINEQMILGNL